MDYDARKDSLLSEQESEKVEIYLSTKNVNTSSLYLEVYMQETDKPRKKIFQTKPAQSYEQIIDFPDSLTVDYYFEGKTLLM
jgi:hypothetical protein